ncbi:MAG: ATP-binding protein [Candidatus Azobacteroides sp.]|nr:ATP-binding protein [Candidatus Azobacteroides sp.]
MDLSALETVVFDQKELFAKEDTSVPRAIDYDNYIGTEQIVVISGIRRSGKSTLLRQFASHFTGYRYLNFDDDRLIRFEVDDFSNLMLLWQKQGDFNTVFLDEIQNVFQWERFVRRIYNEGYKVFITGSNSKLLSSELSTHLTGRHKTIELFPFSFVEFSVMKKIAYENIKTTPEKAKLLAAFDEYLLEGGFPYYCKTKEKDFLTLLYDNILYKDVLFRFTIRDKRSFRESANFVLTNIGKEFSYENIAKTLNIKSSSTVKMYLDYMEEAYLIFTLSKYDFSLKKQYTSNKKLYVIDNGLRNNVAFSFSSDKGRLLENAVFLELKRRGGNIYFHRDKKECDFLIQQGTRITEAVQVCYELNDENKDREMKGLLEAMNYYQLETGTIITRSQSSAETFANKNIRIVPSWKWFTGNTE